ncbi:MBL fold metallo-hydrolase, partial [Patescibacteria group bacterium]|nr:MBL fold metallo-hydrolase [Patescibacteria group bacterium]
SVSAIGAFSAHGDRYKLARWLQPEEGPAQDIFLVHGDPAVKVEFKEFLEEQLESKVHIPGYQELVEF